MNQAKWILLVQDRELEDVQAGLSIAITVISTYGTWIFARLCWQVAVKRHFRDGSIPPRSMLNVGGVQEVIDTFSTLKARMFCARNLKLFLRCIIILCFAICTQLAGLIARWSLANGETIVATNIIGSLANDLGFGWESNAKTASIEWNLTEKALNRAEFPYDRLLDFVPPATSNWRYESSQWKNTTWQMKCDMHALKQHNLGPLLPQPAAMDVHDTTPEMFSGFSTTIPSQYVNRTAYRRQYATAGFCNCDPTHHFGSCTMVTWFFLIMSDPSLDDRMFTNMGDLEFSIGLVTILDATLDVCTEGFQVHFTGNASQTLTSSVDCTLHRTVTGPDNGFSAWPWTNLTQDIPNALADHYRHDVNMALLHNQKLDLPSPERLIRFYQAYMISKDMLFGAPVQRLIDISIDAVYMSTIFLTTFSLLTALLLGATVFTIVFWFRKHETTKRFPESRSSWMLTSKYYNHVHGDEETGCNEKCRFDHGEVNFGATVNRPQLASKEVPAFPTQLPVDILANDTDTTWSSQVSKELEGHIGNMDDVENSNRPVMKLQRAETLT